MLLFRYTQNHNIFQKSSTNNYDSNITDVTLTIAIPYQEEFFHIDDSYYKDWLEEQTGYHIVFDYISSTYTEEYLHMLLSNANTSIDAIFFSEETTPSMDTLDFYVESGFLTPLNTFISEGSNIQNAFNNHLSYNLKKAISNDDQLIYYMPALHTSENTQYLQNVWININWLEAVDLAVPTTTDELINVLLAFQTHFPDKIPMMGSIDSEHNFICNFLMNSFTTCDPINYYFALDQQNNIYYPPSTDSWREGLRYCHSLYEQGFIPIENFTFTTEQFISICNDPDNIIGIFATNDISSVLYESSPELLSQFFIMSPLASSHTPVTTIHPYLPDVGGVVLSSSNHQEEAFILMDVMCSEEAYLIGHFGEYGIDWEEAHSTDISTAGNPAVISVTTNGALERNNNSETLFGPFITVPYYADRIAWKGYQVNQDEYLQQRANSLYQNFQPTYTLPYLKYSDYSLDITALESLSTYTKSWMIDFIIGEKDIDDNEMWDLYLTGFSLYNLPTLQEELVQQYK